MAVERMEYLQNDNGKLCLINDALVEKNRHNVSYIEQLQKELRDIRDIKDKQQHRKRVWRRVALIEGAILVIIIALIV